MEGPCSREQREQLLKIGNQREGLALGNGVVEDSAAESQGAWVNSGLRDC